MESNKRSPKSFDPSEPKKTDSQGYDEDGVLHDHCGTPECCGKCDTAETGVNNGKAAH